MIHESTSTDLVTVVSSGGWPGSEVAPLPALGTPRGRLCHRVQPCISRQSVNMGLKHGTRFWLQDVTKSVRPVKKHGDGAWGISAAKAPRGCFRSTAPTSLTFFSTGSHRRGTSIDHGVTKTDWLDKRCCGTRTFVNIGP